MTPVDILCKLIRIPSVNPMGREVEGDIYNEHRVTAYLREYFSALGASCRALDVAPEQQNVIAWLPGEPGPLDGGSLIIWEAHQDTVAIDGMTIDPFAAEVRGGRVWGRGACDVKGGMASMLSAFARLAETSSSERPTVVMACSVNEEFGCAGARQLASLWKQPDEGCVATCRAPDAVIVAEPTRLNMVTSHKGVVRWKCRALGRAAHSSRPELGENAIYRMSRAVTALQDYAERVAPQLPPHPQLGEATLSVGVIEGGSSVNIVPDQCWIEIDRRLLPGEDPQSVFADAVAHVEELAPGMVVHEQPYIATPALPDDLNGRLADGLERAIAAQGVTPRRLAEPYCSDASHFASWPTLVFGPGDIAQAHTCDEWIEVEQLEAAAEILYSFARDMADGD
ncbi:MAG: M20 family metallopeptidase [Pirellulaceae bacterium]|nr:M20 family metallopeptidase [Pirellulaceae bacterium]